MNLNFVFRALIGTCKTESCASELCLFLQALEDRLRQKHLEDMQQQMAAHKITLDSVKEQADKARQAHLTEQREKMKREMGKWEIKQPKIKKIYTVFMKFSEKIWRNKAGFNLKKKITHHQSLIILTNKKIRIN